MTDFLEKGKLLQNRLSEYYRHLHSIAETEFDLNKTVSFVKKCLDEMKCSYEDCGKCGITATIGDGNKGKVFLLRADMDALPIKEETGLDFSCKEGNMHACGHDMHTAMLLGAAHILKERENELNGAVKLVFQPAEEILQGARNMIENGVLQSPQVDGAMMIHVVSGVPIPAGTFIVSAGGISAPAADYFTINIHGKSSHGSTPNKGIDSVTAGARILLGLQEISARELNISDEAIITVGSFYGGKAGNVIAESTMLQGTIRAFDDSIRTQVKKRVEEIALNIGQAFRTTVTVSYGGGCPTLKNDEALSNSVTSYLKEVFPAEEVLNTAELNGSDVRGGSDDFSYISHEVPSVMVALGAGEPEKGYKYTVHHGKTTFDESVLWRGSTALAACSVKYLEEV